jgi:hypothetical protein
MKDKLSSEAHKEMWRLIPQLYGVKRLRQMKLRDELKTKIIIQIWERNIDKGPDSGFLECKVGYHFWAQDRHFFIFHRYEIKNSYDSSRVRAAFENTLTDPTIQSELNITKSQYAHNGANKWIIELTFPELKGRLENLSFFKVMDKIMIPILGGDGDWKFRHTNLSYNLSSISDPKLRGMRYYGLFPSYKFTPRLRVRFLQAIGGDFREELLPCSETTHTHAFWKADKEKIRKEYETRQEAYDKIRKAQRRSSIVL